MKGTGWTHYRVMVIAASIILTTTSCSYSNSEDEIQFDQTEFIILPGEKSEKAAKKNAFEPIFIDSLEISAKSIDFVETKFENSKVLKEIQYYPVSEQYTGNGTTSSSIDSSSVISVVVFSIRRDTFKIILQHQNDEIVYYSKPSDF